MKPLLPRRRLLGAAALGLLPWPALAQRELRALNAFAPSFVFSREIAQVFFDNVRKASGGAFGFKVGGPDVVPFAEQFQPTAAGAFDLLFTHPAYHSGTTAIGLAMDAVAADPARRRASGVVDLVDRHYQKLGLKVLGVVPTGSRGFQYISKTPLKAASPSLAGLKVRGTVSYHPMIKALGGSPVVMGGGEVYSALEKGVIDAAAWGLTGVLDFKWNEVAKYYARPAFGQASLYIFMNLASWRGLDTDAQKLLAEEARKLELASVKRFDELAAAELEEMKKRGMQETAFPAADAQRLETLWAQSVWEIARAKNGADADAMRSLAVAHGLSQ
ncbi:TRAP transporter substrate-binding protein DctP [Ramlibacter sp.]|uniref:TRAP transporter substrate-binding protein DctP n=1 Tax=Ramlibacter sp. TaxID=1917967 RepID=UPI0035B33309